MNGTVVKQAQVWTAPNGSVVFNLDKGATVRIEKTEGDWVQFAKVIGGKVRKGYLKKNTVEPVILYKGAVRVNTSLNVRSGPSTSFDRIASLKNDQKVLVLSEVEGEMVHGETKWLEIMHKEGVAFIFAKYVAKTGDAEELASTVDSLEDDGWGDNEENEITEDWADLQEKAAPVVEVKEEEKEEEEQSLWDKVTSWF